jgi:hypothetical protein
MHPQIAERFEALELRRNVFVERVRALPPDKLDKTPGKGFFSPLEVVQHFAIAEEYDLTFLRKTPPSALKGKKPHVTFIFENAVKKMQRPEFPVATFGAMRPKGKTSLDHADKKWQTVRAEMAKYFEQVEKPSDPMVNFLFFFGLASAHDFLRLLEAHMTYHESRFPA